LDLLSFICRRHCLDHSSMLRRWVCRLLIALLMCACRDRIAVSSAKVLKIVDSCCGTSAVNRAYRNGPYTASKINLSLLPVKLILFLLLLVKIDFVVISANKIIFCQYCL
jgi:hypothetical protein